MRCEITLRVFHLVSLLLFITVGALWVRGEFWRDDWEWSDFPAGNNERNLSFNRGRVEYTRIRWYGDDPPDSHGTHWVSKATPDVYIPWRWFSHGTNGDDWSDWSVLGGFVEIQSPRDESPATYAPLTVVVPLWIPMALAAVLPIWGAIRIARARARRGRVRAGQCVECGYDLRASRQKCPECGADVLSSARNARSSWT